MLKLNTKFNLFESLLQNHFSIKSYAYIIIDLKINYNNILASRLFEFRVKKSIIFNKFFIILNKKQTYINVYIGVFKKIHITNGIILKKYKILEKCRKKDPRTSLFSLKQSVISFKKIITNKEQNLIINVKKIKPFINKILKYMLLYSRLKNKKLFVITTPITSFSNFKFKKIKSIKRRLRKKYAMINF